MKQSPSRRTRRVLVESLESRRLLTFSLVTPISDVAATSHASTDISLANHFHDSSLTNTTVVMHIQPYNAASAGADLYVQLTDSVTPQTVANFLAYVNSGAYNNTIIHRSVTGFVVQGGGYVNASGLAHISTNAPVVNEFTQALAAAGGAGNPVNVRGTIAMAKVGGDPDSATSEWFFNLADNSSNLDNQNGGFTTFGTVGGSGMTSIVDTIAGLPQTNLGGAFTNLPLAGNGDATYDNLVTLKYVTAECTYTITGNTNPALFSSVSVVGSRLVLAYAPGQLGSSDLTITATDFSGHTATDTFTVSVTKPTISVSTGGSAVADDQTPAFNFGNLSQGATSSKTFRITNNGNATLTFNAPTVPAGFVISSPADLTAVTVAPGAFVDVTVSSVATNTGGAYAGTLVIKSNDLDTADFDIRLVYAVLTRQASVSYNSGTLTNNQAVNFGSSSAASFNVTLTVKNTGTGTLGLSAPTIPAGYSIVDGLPSALAAGASANLILAVNTATTGVKAGTVVINTDDPNTPAFSVPVTATVFHGITSVELVNSDNSTSALPSPVVYPAIDQNSSTLNSKTFRITNTGNATLVFSAVTEPAGFFISSPSRTFHAGSPSTPPNLGSLAPGASIDIVVTQRSDTGGDKSGTLYLNTNDPNTPAFGIQLSGFTHYRKLEVSYGGSSLAPDATTHVTSSVNLGDVARGSTTLLTFHVSNTGDTLTLSLTAPTLPAGYSVVTELPSTLNPGESADLVVAVDTSTTGARSGTIVINSGDPLYALPVSAPGFRIPVSATVVPAQGIVVSLDGDTIPYGQATTIDFGKVRQGATGQQVTLTISNSGLLPLAFQTTSLPAGYTLVQSLPDSLAPGASAQLTISLDTANTGIYDGTIHIVSSDPDRPSFDIPVSAGVTLPVKLGASGAPYITFTDADGTVSTITLTGPGSATLDFLGNNLVANAATAKLKKSLAHKIKALKAKGGAVTGTKVSGSSITLAGMTLTGTSAAKTKLVITSTGGKVKTVDIGDVSGTAISSFTAKAGKLVGGLDLNVKTLTLAAASGATLQLAAGSTVVIPSVTDTDLSSSGNVKSLKVTSWNGGSIAAKSVDSMLVSGNLTADLDVKGSLSKATVKGNVGTGTWTLGGISKLAVSGNVASDWVGSIAGNVTGLTVGKNFSGSLTAKVLAMTVKGSVTSATIDATNTLTSLAVKGQFTNSNLSAKAINKASLGTIKTHNGGTALTISSSSIKSLIAKLDTAKTLKLSAVTSTAKLNTELAALKVGSLNDLQITIA